MRWSLILGGLYLLGAAALLRGWRRASGLQRMLALATLVLAPLAWWQWQPPADGRVVLMMCLIGLFGAFILVSSNLSMLTGSESLLVKTFPEFVVLLGIVGLGIALWLKRSNPELYARLGRAFD